MNIRYFYTFVICLLSVSCARVGSPSGGDKDQTPPKLLKAVPTNQTVDFKEKKIRLFFDEYVILKDLRKQLIISPPMEYFPDVSPMGNASRYIDIKIIDTLKPNTTYSFNFGNSIQDNNEGNPLPFFKYVFSTGQSIDSLSVKGKIFDALNPKPEHFVNVMLYEIKENFNDSIIYKEKPIYLTNTLDSLTNFEITNVRAGKYLLVAMKDKNGNYLFDPKQDKIASAGIISVPTDTLYQLSLYKEIPANKTLRPFQAAQNRISIGYEGVKDSIKIRPLPPLPSNFRFTISKDPQKDTLNLWFSPKLEDSLRLEITNLKTDTFRVSLRKMKPDPIGISHESKSISPSLEQFVFSSNIPIEKIDNQKITILNQDSLAVNISPELSPDKMKITYHLPVEKSKTYRITAYPNFLTNFLEETNDTIQAQVKGKKAEDFAKVKVIFRKKEVSFPIIIQLTDPNYKTIYEQYAETAKDFYLFDFVLPNSYLIRVIEDKNKNKKWDTGNYLKHLQPERIFHFPNKVDARANWEIEEKYE